MRITIEDLEALKELNDELEENHMETEKALQEEISQNLTLTHSQSIFTYCISLPRCERYADPRTCSEGFDP